MGRAAAFAAIIVILVVGAVAAYAIYQWGRQLAVSRQARAQVATTDEYRRLSEGAVAAQEHANLKLDEISIQLVQIRDQMDQVQKVLREVE